MIDDDKDKDPPSSPWVPRCDWSPWTRQTVEMAMAANADKPESIRKLLRESIEHPNIEVWFNDHYIVTKTKLESPPGWPEMVELSIRHQRNDVTHDWRSFQKIKDDLVGKDCEGIELYPAHSRLMDTANQYYMYVLTDPGVVFPFGRPATQVGVAVWDDGEGPERWRGLGKQRPLSEPLP